MELIYFSHHHLVKIKYQNNPSQAIPTLEITVVVAGLHTGQTTCGLFHTVISSVRHLLGIVFTTWLSKSPPPKCLLLLASVET